MTTAAEQYRKLVAKLEEINDPRSQEERDSQMANFKGAYQDYQDAEEKKNSDAMNNYGQKVAAANTASAPAASNDVKKIQTMLNAKGAKLAVDGRLGTNTITAIVKHLEGEQGAKWTIDGEPVTGKNPQWSIDGKPVPQSNSATTDISNLGKQTASTPWAKGDLFNR